MFDVLPAQNGVALKTALCGFAAHGDADRGHQLSEQLELRFVYSSRNSVFLTLSEIEFFTRLRPFFTTR